MDVLPSRLVGASCRMQMNRIVAQAPGLIYMPSPPPRARDGEKGVKAMKLRAWLMLVSLAFVGPAAAQSQAPHVCGAGPGPNEVMAGMNPGGNGLAPTPLCYWKSQQQPQQQQPPQPTGYWEKTWGAIAPSPKGGVLGTALGASTKEEAEQRALADCKAKGGGACQVELVYRNQCGVMTLGKSMFFTASAATVEDAKAYGIELCEAEDTNCRVYYSACTEPIFHRY